MGSIISFALKLCITGPYSFFAWAAEECLEILPWCFKIGEFFTFFYNLIINISSWLWGSLGVFSNSLGKFGRIFIKQTEALTIDEDEMGITKEITEKEADEESSRIQKGFWETATSLPWVGWIFEFFEILITFIFEASFCFFSNIVYTQFVVPMALFYYFIVIPLLALEEDPMSVAANFNVFSLFITSILNVFILIENVFAEIWNLFICTFINRFINFVIQVFLVLTKAALGGYQVAPQKSGNTGRRLGGWNYDNVLVAKQAQAAIGNVAVPIYSYIDTILNLIFIIIDTCADFISSVLLYIIRTIAAWVMFATCALTSPPVSIFCAIWDYLLGRIEDFFSTFIIGISLSDISCPANVYTVQQSVLANGGLGTVPPPPCFCAKINGGPFYKLQSCPTPKYICQPNSETGFYTEYLDRGDGTTNNIPTAASSKDQDVACPHSRLGGGRRLYTKSEETIINMYIKCYDACIGSTVSKNPLLSYGHLVTYCYDEDTELWNKKPYEGKACDKYGHEISLKSKDLDYHFLKLHDARITKKEPEARILRQFDWDIIKTTSAPTTFQTTTSSPTISNTFIQDSIYITRDYILDYIHSVWSRSESEHVVEKIPLIVEQKDGKNIFVECENIKTSEHIPLTFDILLYRQLCFLLKGWKVNHVLTSTFIMSKLESVRSRKLDDIKSEIKVPIEGDNIKFSKQFPIKQIHSVVRSIYYAEGIEEFNKNLVKAHREWMKDNDKKYSLVGRYDGGFQIYHDYIVNSTSSPPETERRLDSNQALLRYDIPNDFGLFSGYSSIKNVQNKFLCMDGVTYVPRDEIITCPQMNAPYTVGMLFRYIAYLAATFPRQPNLRDSVSTALECHLENLQNPEQDPYSIGNVRNYYAGVETPGLVWCFPSNILRPIPIYPLIDFNFYTDILEPICTNQLVPVTSNNQVPLKKGCVCDMYPDPYKINSFNVLWTYIGGLWIPARLYSAYKTYILTILILSPAWLFTPINYAWYFFFTIFCSILNVFNFLIPIGLCPTELYYVWDLVYQMNGYTNTQIRDCIIIKLGSFSWSFIVLYITFMIWVIFKTPVLKLSRRLIGLFLIRGWFNLLDFIAIKEETNYATVYSNAILIKKESRYRRITCIPLCSCCRRVNTLAIKKRKKQEEEEEEQEEKEEKKDILPTYNVNLRRRTSQLKSS